MVGVRVRLGWFWESDECSAGLHVCGRVCVQLGVCRVGVRV